MIRLILLMLMFSVPMWAVGDEPPPHDYPKAPVVKQKQKATSHSKARSSSQSHADVDIDYERVASSAASNLQAYCTKGRGLQLFWFGTSTNETERMCLGWQESMELEGLASRLRTRAGYLERPGGKNDAMDAKTRAQVNRLLHRARKLEADAEESRERSHELLMAYMDVEPQKPSKAERVVIRGWDILFNTVLFPVKLVLGR